MESTDISKKLEDILQSKGFENILPNKKIEDDLGADSLEVIEIIMACESSFDISIPDEKIDKVATVQDLVDLIKKLKE
jgi:acyl carrier protein